MNRNKISRFVGFMGFIIAMVGLIFNYTRHLSQYYLYWSMFIGGTLMSIKHFTIAKDKNNKTE